MLKAPIASYTHHIKMPKGFKQPLCQHPVVDLNVVMQKDQYIVGLGPFNGLVIDMRQGPGIAMRQTQTNRPAPPQAWQTPTQQGLTVKGRF